MFHRNPGLNSCGTFSSYGALSMLGIAVALCTLCAIGIFKAADDYCNDCLTALGSGTSGTNDVLLVYAPEDYFADPACTELLNVSSELFQLQAKKVGLVFAPNSNQLNSLAQSTFASRLIAGSKLNTQIERHKSATDSSATRAVKLGYLNLKSDQAVYRQHRVFADTGNARFPSFEFAISNQLHASSSTMSDPIVGIRFVGKADSIPHVKAKDVVDHEIVSELVRDKVVLIGPNRRDAINENAIGFATPSTGLGKRLSRLELHGNVLNTLLNQNGFKSPGLFVTSLLILLVTIVGTQLFRQLSAKRAVIAVGVGMLALLMICWGLSQYFSIKLPVVPLSLAFSLSFVAGIFTRFVSISESLENLRLLQQTNPSFVLQTDNDDDVWSLVSDSIYQTIYPLRLVLLDLEPKARHLTVAKTVNCGPDNIAERRRDIRRSPYAHAIEAGIPVVCDHQFLSDNPADEKVVEYLVPLQVMSKLSGMMVLEMSVDSLSNWNNFENYLGNLATDLATYVDEKKAKASRKVESERFCNRLRTTPEQQLEEELKENEILLSKTLELSSSTRNASQAAVAIGDAFGQLYNVNPKMTAILQRHDVVIDDSNCVDALAAIADLEKAECRTMIRRCLSRGESQKLFVGSGKHSTSPLMVYLEPLGSGNQRGEIASQYFSIQVVEGRAFQRSESWKAELAAQNAQQLQVNLASLKALSQTFSKNPNRANKDSLQDMRQLISSCEALTRGGFSEDPADCILFDTRSIWESTLQLRQPELEASSVQVISNYEHANGGDDTTNDQYHAVSNPFLLERVFLLILDCISIDQTQNTNVLVDATSVGNKINYSFRHSAGGSIVDTNESHSNEDDTNAIVEQVESILTPAQLDQFREIESWLSEWNASLKIRCCDRFHLNVELELSSQIKPSHQSKKRLTSQNVELDFNEF